MLFQTWCHPWFLFSEHDMLYTKLKMNYFAYILFFDLTFTWGTISHACILHVYSFIRCMMHAYIYVHQYVVHLKCYVLNSWFINLKLITTHFLFFTVNYPYNPCKSRRPLNSFWVFCWAGLTCKDTLCIAVFCYDEIIICFAFIQSQQKRNYKICYSVGGTHVLVKRFVVASFIILRFS